MRPMTDHEPHPDGPATGEQETGRQAAGESGEPDWKRRRRLAEIFGEVLPSATSDDRDPDSAPQKESAQDAWLKSQVPPHHGGH